MSSGHFGEEPRSGGKMLRGRRRAPLASPYRRPENSPPPPTPPPENPNWFSGIVSGAGKLLSFFRSSASSSSCSSGSDSDEDICEISDEEENLAASNEKFDELGQTGKKSESCKNLWDATQPTTGKSERKLAIEMLLMQETFSRDECERLTKIIQSRVVDHPTIDAPNKTICSTLAFSPNQGRRRHETLSNSSNHLNDLLLGSSVLRTYTPELRSSAIMEARKWYEEKKMASTLTTELDRGPCTLNTDMLHCDTEDEVGSPVDVARSYMRTLPPWQSPILSSSTIGFKTPPPSLMHLLKDDAPYATGNLFLASPKGLKRTCLAAGFDETQRARLKLAENISGPTIPSQIDSSSGVLEHETHQIAPVADQRVLGVLGTKHDSSSLPATEATKSVGASSEFSRELSMKNGCSDEIINSPDERTVERNLLTNCEVNNGIDALNGPDNDPVHERTVHEATIMHENLVRNTLPSETEVGLESLTYGLESPEFHMTHKNQNLVEEPLIKEKGSRVYIRHESHILDPSTVDNNDARVSVEELLDSEPEVIPSKDEVPFPSNAEDVNFTNIHAPAVQRDSGSTKALQVQSSSQDLLLPGLEARHVALDPRLQDENDQIQKEVNMSVSKIGADGVYSFQSSSTADPSISSLNKGEHSSTYSSSCELAAGVTVGTRELSSDVPIDNSIMSKVQNGTTMKSIKQMLAENPPNPTRGRSRKAVAARPRRGKGRGK